jgi:hypothetical protein
MSFYKNDRYYLTAQLPFVAIYGIHTYFQVATLWLLTFFKNILEYVKRSKLFLSFIELYSLAGRINSLNLGFYVGKMCISESYTDDLIVYSLCGAIADILK